MELLIRRIAWQRLFASILFACFMAGICIPVATANSSLAVEHSGFSVRIERSESGAMDVEMTSDDRAVEIPDVLGVGTSVDSRAATDAVWTSGEAHVSMKELLDHLEDLANGFGVPLRVPREVGAGLEGGEFEYKVVAPQAVSPRFNTADYVGAAADAYDEAGAVLSIVFYAGGRVAEIVDNRLDPWYDVVRFVGGVDGHGPGTRYGTPGALVLGALEALEIVLRFVDATMGTVPRLGEVAFSQSVPTAGAKLTLPGVEIELPVPVISVTTQMGGIQADLVKVDETSNSSAASRPLRDHGVTSADGAMAALVPERSTGSPRGPIDPPAPVAASGTETRSHATGHVDAEPLDNAIQARPHPWFAILGASALLAIGLLHRLYSTDRLLKSAARRRLYEIVGASESLHAAELARRSGVTITTATYHLRLLHAHGFIAVQRIGKRDHYYRSGTGNAPQRKARALIADDSRRALLRAIVSKPEATLRELAATCGLSPSAVYCAVNRLESEGLLQTTREPRRIRYKVSQAAIATLGFEEASDHARGNECLAAVRVDA